MNMCCKAGEKHTRVLQTSFHCSYAHVPMTLEVKSATDLGAASKIQDGIKIQCFLIFVEINLLLAFRLRTWCSLASSTIIPACGDDQVIDNREDMIEEKKGYSSLSSLAYRRGSAQISPGMEKWASNTPSICCESSSLIPLAEAYS